MQMKGNRIVGVDTNCFCRNTKNEYCDYVWGSLPRVTAELTPEGEEGFKLMIRSDEGIPSQNKSMSSMEGVGDSGTCNWLALIGALTGKEWGEKKSVVSISLRIHLRNYLVTSGVSNIEDATNSDFYSQSVCCTELTV